MATQMTAVTDGFSERTDEQIISAILAGATALYEVLIRRYNRRLYRVVRGILRDEAETEDVMQEAYVRAYQHLRDFEGRASFSTWLIRIAVHEALAREKRVRKIITRNFADDEEGEMTELLHSNNASPEVETANEETRAMLERAILALPSRYRTVLMMRDIEEMSTADTAVALELSEEAVKVRLHRARAMLRRELFQRVGATSSAAFQFPATRCDRVTHAVMRRLSLEPHALC